MKNRRPGRGGSSGSDGDDFAYWVWAALLGGFIGLIFFLLIKDLVST